VNANAPHEFGDMQHNTVLLESMSTEVQWEITEFDKVRWSQTKGNIEIGQMIEGHG
jgi:hypothetical protein